MSKSSRLRNPLESLARRGQLKAGARESQELIKQAARKTGPRSRRTDELAAAAKELRERESLITYEPRKREKGSAPSKLTRRNAESLKPPSLHVQNFLPQPLTLGKHIREYTQVYIGLHAPCCARARVKLNFHARTWEGWGVGR